MSNAARRVLELFLQTPTRGVTGVTGVTRQFVTPEGPIVTPVTRVTCQKQHSPSEGVTGATPEPEVPVETLTFENRIVDWQYRNPASSTPDRCLWCGQIESSGASIVPFGFEPGGHAWLHGECWPHWYRARRAEAAKALDANGALPDAEPGRRR